MAGHAPLWPVGFRTNAIKPVICGDKVAAGVANNGDPEFLERFNDILAEAVFVGQRVAWVVDAAVDAPAYVSVYRN